MSLLFVCTWCIRNKIYKKDMAELSDNAKKGWAFTLIMFGILFFIKQTSILPTTAENLIMDWHNYPLYAAVIFFIVKELKIAAVLTGIGLLFHGAEVIKLTQNLSHYMWPLLLVAAGVVLLLSIKK